MKTLGPRIKPAPSRVRAPDKQALPFYLSPEWRGLMARLLKERGRVCQHCGRTECRIFGDHRIELKDGGAALDPRNIELLCGKCHGIKTAAAAALRAAAVR